MEKAPDKIYVCIPQRLNLSTFKEDSKYVGMAYNDKGNLRSPQIEEYIRKDALLEWAKEMRKIAEEQSDNIEERYFKGCSFAYDQLIEKLQSL